MMTGTKTEVLPDPTGRVWRAANVCAGNRVKTRECVERETHAWDLGVWTDLSR